MGSLIFDTTFLIDYQRERKKGAGGAHRFVFDNLEESFFLSVVAMGEFGEGFGTLDDAFYLKVIGSFQVLPITQSVASIYSKFSRKLRQEGQLIGDNDLWIAAVALDCGFPLVTTNLDHFGRIPGLELRSY